MIQLHRCRVTGRRWLNLGKGWLAVGFAGIKPDRMFWRKRLVWAKAGQSAQV